MLQAQHLYNYQQQYGQHDQTAWQHENVQPGQHSMSHAQGLANAVQQHQHTQRMTVNPSHNTGHTQRSNRQSSADNATTNGTGSLTSVNDQLSVGMEPNLTDENRKVLQWVAELMDPARREGALMELSKKREQVPELALILWHSFGVMTSLLQEIISVYPLLNPSQLTAAASNRVCNALALLQCVASHNETRTLFLNGTSFQSRGVRDQADSDLRWQHTFPCSSTPFSTPPRNLDRSSTFVSHRWASSARWSKMSRRRLSTQAGRRTRRAAATPPRRSPSC